MRGCNPSGERREMLVGVPKEVKNHEYRVAITPAGVHELVAHGHDVVVQADAGIGSSITDDEFIAAGAKILPTADDVWQSAEMILKVKEPIAEEYGRMRDGQTLFTYLHLAASRECTDALLRQGVTAIAYETVQTPDGALPAAGTDVGGCRPAGAAGRRLPPDAPGGRPWRPDGWRLRRLRGQGRRDRCRRIRHERRRDRARHAGRGAAAGPQHRAAAAGRPYLPGPSADHRVEQVRGRARRRWTPTWSSARCWCPGRRRRR